MPIAANACQRAHRASGAAFQPTGGSMVTPYLAAMADSVSIPGVPPAVAASSSANIWSRPQLGVLRIRTCAGCSPTLRRAWRRPRGAEEEATRPDAAGLWLLFELDPQFAAENIECLILASMGLWRCARAWRKHGLPQREGAARVGARSLVDVGDASTFSVEPAPGPRTKERLLRSCRPSLISCRCGSVDRVQGGIVLPT